MRRPPLYELLSPAEAFVAFVAACTLGIVATILMIVFFPWSIPFWIGAMILWAWAVARFMRRLRRN